MRNTFSPTDNLLTPFVSVHRLERVLLLMLNLLLSLEFLDHLYLISLLLQSIPIKPFPYLTRLLRELSLLLLHTFRLLSILFALLFMLDFAF